MGDSSAAAPAKKAKVTKTKKPKSAPTHPKVSEMVNAAITSLKERGGSSLQAIKKYIAASYKVDAEKLSPFIKKYLKSSVVSGGLIQTKGTGATGSFRIGGLEKKKTEASKPKKAAAKSPKPKKAKAATPKKAAKPKKAVAKKAKSPAKKVKSPAKKVKAVKKPKAVKLVAVKPKKTKKTTPKKAAAKKGSKK